MASPSLYHVEHHLLKRSSTKSLSSLSYQVDDGNALQKDDIPVLRTGSGDRFTFSAGWISIASTNRQIAYPFASSSCTARLARDIVVSTASTPFFATFFVPTSILKSIAPHLIRKVAHCSHALPNLAHTAVPSLNSTSARATTEIYLVIINARAIFAPIIRELHVAY